MERFRNSSNEIQNLRAQLKDKETHLKAHAEALEELLSALFQCLITLPGVNNHRWDRSGAESLDQLKRDPQAFAKLKRLRARTH